MINEREVLKAAGRGAITTFLQSQNAFELVRISGKVFDVLVMQIMMRPGVGCCFRD